MSPGLKVEIRKILHDGLEFILGNSQLSLDFCSARQEKDPDLDDDIERLRPGKWRKMWTENQWQ